MTDKITSLYSVEMEQTVLGMFLTEKSCRDEISLRITPEHIFDPNLKVIFRWLIDRYESDQEIRSELLLEYLKNAPSALAMVGSVLGSIGVPECIEEYISILAAKLTDRRLYTLGQKLVEGVLQDHEREGLILRSSKELDSLESGSSLGVISGPEPWDAYHALMNKPVQDAGGRVLVTGFGNLDSRLKIKGGQVVVIAACEKQGKSTFAGELALRWWQQGIPGTIACPEMSAVDWQTMIMAKVTGVPRDALEARALTPERLETLAKATLNAKKWPWAIYDKQRITAREFRALCREQARRGHEFMVLDYFQRLSSETKGRYEHRHLELEENSRLIKDTALETGLAIILLSQLNTKSVDGRPIMANLRGTGAIGQDADTVILLSEPDPKKRPKGMRCMLADIAASRRSQEIDTHWFLDGAHARFMEADSLWTVTK